MNQSTPPPTEQRQTSLGLIYVIVFGALAVLFYVASLGSEVDAIGSIFAAALFAAIIVGVIGLTRRGSR